MTSGRKSRNRLIYTNYCGESGSRTYTFTESHKTANN